MFAAPTQQARCALEKGVGFFLPKLLLSRNLWVFRHDENSLSSKELPAFPFCIPSVISVRAEIQTLRMLLLSTCLQVPQEGDSDKSLSSATGCCPASEQEWLRNNLKTFPWSKERFICSMIPLLAS